MKNTIEAKQGYVIKGAKLKDSNIPVNIVKDGEQIIMICDKASFEKYIDECVNGNNECAELCEIFTTVKGNQFIYWRDNELDIDYLTKVV